MVRAMRGDLQRSLETAKARLAEVQGTVVAGAKATATEVDDYVQANPWRAMGFVAAFAMVTGLVAGLMLSRRPPQ